MKRLLFLSIPVSIVACSILPMVGGINEQDSAGAKAKESIKDEPAPLPLPLPIQNNKTAQLEKQRLKKIATYTFYCSSIKTEDLKTEIAAKLDCLAELNQ